MNLSSEIGHNTPQPGSSQNKLELKEENIKETGMEFKETKLKGSYIIEPKRYEDERGFFCEMWRKDTYEKLNLEPTMMQANISFTKKKGTLRGMHFQVEPHAQVKLVRCTMGGIYDVIIDLRPDSPTYCKWISVELTADNRRMLYVPVGFAHGFQTIQDNTEVSYQMFELYHPECEGGVRYNDPCFNIEWPLDVTVISKRDADYPDYQRLQKV